MFCAVVILTLCLNILLVFACALCQTSQFCSKMVIFPFSAYCAAIFVTIATVKVKVLHFAY